MKVACIYTKFQAKFKIFYPFIKSSSAGKYF